MGRVIARGPEKERRFSDLGYSREEFASWDQRESKRPPPYKHAFNKLLPGLEVGDPVFDALPASKLVCHGQRAGVLPQNDEPSWVEWDRVRRGQELWLYHLSRAFTGLGLSLLSGFSIARFAEVLYHNGYAVDGPTAMKRYGATSFAILDFFSHDLSDPDSRARQSIYTVRAMHAFARRKAAGLFDPAKGEGMPLSQLDMAEVQLGFSAVCMTFIETELGYGPIHREDAKDMVHLWRFVGWHLGIQDEFNVCTSLDDLDAYMADYMAWTPRRMETITFATKELRRTAIEGFALQTGLGENFWYAAFDLVFRSPRVDLSHLKNEQKNYLPGIDAVARLSFKAFGSDTLGSMMRYFLITQREDKLKDPARAAWRESTARRLSVFHDKLIWRIISFLYVCRHLFGLWALVRFVRAVTRRVRVF